MVTVPGLGDEVQAIKAGVMEVGDIFVVNKADLDGARRAARQLRAMLALNQGPWRPPVELVTATNGEGVDGIWALIEDHRTFMNQDSRALERRRNQARDELIGLAQRHIVERATSSPQQSTLIDELSQRIASRQLDPYSALAQLLPQLLG